MTTTLQHIAIIPDGNRRWARKRGLKAWDGHKSGFARIEELLDVFVEENIPYFSLWGASIENITKRDKKEVSFLLKLLERRLKDIAKEKRIHENKVRIRVLGFWREYVPESLQKAIINVEKLTQKYDRHNFTLLLAYNGREEILRCVKKISAESRGNKRVKIDAQEIKQGLLTKDLPPVDLVIRTGGEPHLSAGFMMWDTADAQLYFTDKYFPDFDKKELRVAVEDYKKRERRFGA